MGSNKKTIRSSLFLGAGQSIEIIAALILMPFLISTLGTKSYGLWILINSVVGYLMILNMGLSTAIERELSKLKSSEEIQKYKEVFSSGFFTLIGLATIALIFVIICVMFSHSIISDESLRTTISIILWIFGVKTALLLPTIAFQAVISSELRHDMFVIAEQIMVIIKVILIIVIVGITKNIIHLALIIAICEILSRIFIVILAVKLKGSALLSYSPPSTQIMKKLLVYSSPSIGIWFAERVRGSLPNFTLSYYISLEAIAIYNIGYMIATYVGQMIAVCTSPLMPYFTKLLATPTNEILNKEGTLLKSINYAYAVVIVPISLYIIGFIFSGESFILLLFDIKDRDAYHVGIILSFYALLYCSQQPFSKLFYSKGSHHQLLLLTVIEVCAIAILSIFLVPSFGLIGQALAVLIPFFYTRHYLIYKKYQYDENFSANNIKLSTRLWLIPLLILSPLSYFMSNTVKIDNWTYFMVFNLILLLFLSIFYYLYTKKIATRIWDYNHKKLIIGTKQSK